MAQPMTFEQLWASPGVKTAAGVLLVALLVLSAFRSGSVFVKWFVGLVIISTLLVRWDNTIRPWLFG